VATARQLAEAEEDFLAGENHSGSHRNICQVVLLSVQVEGKGNLTDNRTVSYATINFSKRKTAQAVFSSFKNLRRADFYYYSF
jgi:hypothetical protein